MKETERESRRERHTQREREREGMSKRERVEGRDVPTGSQREQDTVPVS